MKAQYLKISGHKNEKSFYKEFPTMESFMAKHGAKLKKAQTGLQVDSNKNGVPDYLERINTNNEYTDVNGMSQQFGSNIPQLAPTTNTARFAKPVVQQDEQLFDPSSVIKPYQKTNQDILNERTAIIEEKSKAAPANTKASVQTGISFVDSISNGFKALNAEKKAKKNARIWKNVSDVSRKAFDTPDINKDQTYADNARRTRKALMPTVTGEELFPVYGVGTNSLGQSKNGGKLKKANNGEIMNTYAPKTIYDDLGYEPLGESTYKPLSNKEIIKAYKSGGHMPKAFWGSAMGSAASSAGASSAGSSGMMSGIMSQMGSSASATTDANGGSQVGGGIGEGIGSIWGPVGAMVGKLVGGIAGGLIDKNPGKIKKYNNARAKNIAYMSSAGSLRNSQSMYNGSLKNGGNVNPQVIKYLGDNDVKDLFKKDPTMNTLRTGGNIRSNSVGDVETVSGGHLEPISYNPNTSGSGVTSMIKGQSHDESNGVHSGVILDYNGNRVEAERGEPISERQDGGTVGETAVIAGDQTFSKLASSILPHLKKYEGKKIKNIQKDIANKDAKLNKFDSKNSIALNSFDPKTAIDKLTLNSYVKNAEGIQQKYKINAEEVDDILAYQDAVNQTAEVMGADAGDLSRGKIKYIPKNKIAQDGTSLPKGAKGNIDPNTVYSNTSGNLDYTPVGPSNPNSLFSSEEVYSQFKKDTERAYDDPEVAKQLVQYFREYDGEDWQDVRSALNKGRTFEEQRQIAKKLATDHFPGRFHINTSVFNKPKLEVKTTASSQKPEAKTEFDVTPYNGAGWDTLAGQILPWFRKVPGEPLYGEQLAGELTALREDVDPVQARFYHPNLRTPYDVSYQDQLNENQADFNQLVDVSGNNPQALSALAAQKYSANSKVLGEQLRTNQAMKENVYSQNTATLNDALLKNLSIADQQYVRQSQAKSNTKEIRKAAIDSIAAKTLLNRYENKQLQVGSNEFKDFSYDSSMRLNRTGAPTTFYIPQNYSQDTEIKKEKNGGLVKAFKNL